MHINQLKQSKYLKRSDVTKPVLVTIQSFSEENVAMEGKPPEMRWAMHFKELPKPMIVNSTNAQIIAGFLGSEETDDWVGKKVVLYDDPNITFGGKLVGGIRVRQPKNQPKPAPKPAPTPEPEPEIEPELVEPEAEDDVPF